MQTAILTFIIPIISLIFTCAFLAFWWNDRKQWPVLAFAVCFASLALGIAINIWIIEQATSFGIVAYHIVSMTGLLALMWGVSKRANVKAPIGFCATTVMLVSPLLWYCAQAGYGDAMRLAQNTNSAMITAIIAVCLWYGTKRNSADHVLMWVLIALAAFGFVRPVLTIIVSALPGEEGAAMAILGAIHILYIATALTLIALCLIASIVFGTMQHERERATTDPLTGLANRAAFEDKVGSVLELARNERLPVSLVVGDIDNFKAVNDTWGHSAGDKVISTFGSMIQNRTRPRDIAGRIGGEEFCILIWNCSEASAVSLANRLRLSFANAHIPGFSNQEHFSASFGVAQCGDDEGYAQAFARADQALYAAKRAGRNRVEAASASAPGSKGGTQQFDTENLQANHSCNQESGEIVSFEKIKAAKPGG